MKIDCSQELKTLAGGAYRTDDRALTLGDVIAEALGSEKSGGKMKLYALAQKVYGATQIDVDMADLTLIKRAVETCQSYNGNSLILGQALGMLEKVTE